MPRQGFIEYPNVTGPIGGSYTLSHGISPGTFVIQLVPQAQLVPEYGNVQITFDGLTITFPDCKLVAPSSQFNEAGQLISIMVLDRRWRWRYGEISGRYNIRRPNGVTIEPTGEKTPQELATLCLQAMGEANFDVSALPNDPRPEIDWDYDNPASELAELCEELGCRVVLGTDDVVRICRKGVGNALPDNGRIITLDFGIDAGVRPSHVKFVAGPTRYQTRFFLEAVGLTDSGSYLPLDQLPYKPSGGWESEFPASFLAVLDQFGKEAHQLALRSMYRVYRIKGTAPDGTDFTFGYTANSAPGTASGLTEILPVEDVLVEAYAGPDGVFRQSPAVVRGEFWSDLPIQPDSNTGTATAFERYHKAFSVNGNEGLVEFSDPVIRIENDKIYPARLTLETTHPVRVEETRQVYRWTRQQAVPGVQFQTKPMLVPVDEAALTVIQEYDATGSPTQVRTNEQQLQGEADAVLTDTLEQFQQPQSYELSYEGFLDISPDGAIQQVGWQFSERGAFTTASLNTEWDNESPSFEERRRREREGRARRNARKIIDATKKVARNLRRFFRGRG